MRRRGVHANRRRGRLRRRLGLALLALVPILLVSTIAVRLRCPTSYEHATTPPPGDRLPIPDGLFPEAERRTVESTYLTFPEWYIVYSAEEYAAWLADRPPSGFPYFRSVGQYWCGYNHVFELSRHRFPFNAGNHLMLGVIGVSYTVEYLIKGVYEGSIGRLAEAVSGGGGTTAEDALARDVAREYGAFLNTIPWYEFPFADRLRQLWTETGLWGDHPVRKWERKVALTLEYGVKAGYGWLLGLATGAVYDEDEALVLVWVEPPPGSITLALDPRVRPDRQVDDRTTLLRFPRWTALAETALPLVRGGARVLSIAGNDELMLTAIAGGDQTLSLPAGRIAFALPLPSDPTRARVAIALPIASLHVVIAALEAQGARVEHLYDY